MLEHAGKRLFDLAGAALLLLVVSPLMALAALLVYADSGRPVFFGQWRMGRGGRPFRCWKVRTMIPDAEQSLDRDHGLRRAYVANGYKLPNVCDPRVTRVGRWLRQRYLDELPQLLNVLAGEMSLVGPRPVVEEELGEYAPHQSELLSVKPGLVGAWASLGPQRPAYPIRAVLELDYVRARSLSRDLTILIRSVPVVLRGQTDS